MRVHLVCGLLLAALASTARAGSGPPTVAVMDLQPNGASPELAHALTGLAANELQRMGLFRVVTSALMHDLLAVERQKALLGCTDASCMSEIGAALGMDLIVAGKVSRVKGSGKSVVALELTLTDAAKARQIASEVEAADSETALMSRIGPVLLRLMSSVLARESGTLLLVTTEAAATVKLDGRVVGTTPLAGPLTVPGGPHDLLIEKQGFVAYQKEVRVTPKALAQETVSLVPSPDFVNAYEAQNGRLRIAAWGTTALAAAGAGVGAVLMWRAAGAYGSANQPGTFVYERAKLLAGIEVEGDIDHRAETLRLKGQVDALQTFGTVSLGVAGASAIGAAILWLVGDDPDRYRLYRRGLTVSPAPTASAALVPMPGGFQTSLQLRF